MVFFETYASPYVLTMIAVRIEVYLLKHEGLSHSFCPSCVKLMSLEYKIGSNLTFNIKSVRKLTSPSLHTKEKQNKFKTWGISKILYSCNICSLGSSLQAATIYNQQPFSSIFGPTKLFLRYFHMTDNSWFLTF